MEMMTAKKISNQLNKSRKPRRKKKKQKNKRQRKKKKPRNKNKRLQLRQKSLRRNSLNLRMAKSDSWMLSALYDSH